MYYMLLFSVIAASFNSVVLNKARVRKKEDVFPFNLIVSLIWLIILFIVNKGHISALPEILFWGILYGLTQTCFILFKTAAMSTGSVSVTTLIGNSSLLISIFVSLIVWKEKITAADIIGLAVLAIAIFMCTYTKNPDLSTTHTPSWKYFAVFFLIFAAGVGIVFKAIGKSGNIEYCGDMMFISSLVMLVSNLVICCFTGGLTSQIFASRGRSFVAFAVLSGILSCLYNRLNVFLAGNMDALIFFPTFNGGVLFLSAALSAFICRERLQITQLIGLAAGISAICLIGIL